MHPPEVRAEVLKLVAAGVNDCEVSRRTGVPRRTVRDMRVQPYVRKHPTAPCPRCWRNGRAIAFNPGDYSEILGLYLGDGHITDFPRAQRLRIAFDSRYPSILRESKDLLVRFFCSSRVGEQYQHDGRMTILWLYSSHLGCLFPQHGPGLKHSRQIELESWQETVIGQEPWALIRGLIRSDGCSFINRTGAYEYLSYDFSNTSDGIAGIFIDACQRVGIEYRANLNRKRNLWQIRINRRDSVARMLEHVGTKA